MSSARELFDKLPDEQRIPPIKTDVPVVEPGQSARDVFNSLPGGDEPSDESAGLDLSHRGGKTTITKPVQGTEGDELSPEQYVKTWGDETAQGYAAAHPQQTGTLEAVGRGIQAAIPFSDLIDAALSPGDFHENLKARRASASKIAEDQPLAYYGGMAGMSLGLPGGKAAATKGLGLLGRLGAQAKAALPTGLVYGALQGASGSRGWEHGTTNAVEVGKDTAVGMGLGGGAAAVLAPVLGAVGEATQAAGAGLNKVANTQAVRAVTNKLNELRRMLGREGLRPGADTEGAINRLGQFIRDKDILPTLGSRAGAARNAEMATTQAGESIGRERDYLTALNKTLGGSDYGIATKPIRQGIRQELLPKYESDFTKAAPGDPDVALRQMMRRLQTFRERVAPNDFYTRLKALENKKGLFNLGPSTPEQQALEQAVGLARGQANEQIGSQLGLLENKGSVPEGTTSNYMEAMKDYAPLQALSNTLNQQTAADTTRRMLSPSTYAAGGLGLFGGVGGAIGELEGGHKQGLKRAAEGMILHQILLHRGNAMLSHLAGGASKLGEGAGGFLSSQASQIGGKVGGSMTRPIPGITNSPNDPRRP